jgi:hypothetical protein
MGDFNVHGWFKKQYLAEDKSDKDKSDKDKVVAATNDGRIKITKGEMERLQNGEVVHLSNGSTLSFVKEGHTEDKTKEMYRAREEDFLKQNPNYEKDSKTAEKVRAMLAKEKELRDYYKGDSDVFPSPLKENMSPGEAVVELNVYMNDLQDISSAVSRIMQEYFPTEFDQGDAYGAFDFGSSRNQYDTTFESILDDLASVGDDMEDDD